MLSFTHLSPLGFPVCFYFSSLLCFFITAPQVIHCYSCGKVGRIADLVVCNQCGEAYYCDRDCQVTHAKAHAKVCVATVTAKAQDAHRVRLARAVREKGKDKVDGAEEDSLCVICQSTPVNPIQVRMCGGLSFGCVPGLVSWRDPLLFFALTDSSRVVTSSAGRAWRS